MADYQMIPDWMLPDTARPAKDHPNPEHERLWKDRIFLRDQGYCQLCCKHADHVGHPDVHHISYERFGSEEEADGILLCRGCHDDVTKEQRRKRMRKT